MSEVVKPSVNVVTDNEYEILRLQKDVGSEIIFNIKDILRDEGINFTGDLSNSFSLIMIGGKASVESDSPYAGIVDRGMSPGTTVNFDALKDWVRIKIGLEEPELTPVTWAIVNAIKTDGIRPRRFGKKALKKLIGEHGATSFKTGGRRNKRSKFTKNLNRINKFVQRVKRTFGKISKNINKYTKPIRRYK